MALPTRTPSVWPGWLTWALPAGIGAIVTGYQVVYQVVIDPARSAGIFWSELLVFGIAGPLVAWLLLRQLALDAAARDAAAQRISALVAEERRRAEEARALVAISTAMNQAMSEEEALSGALRSVMDEFGFDGGRIYLLDARSGVYTIAATQGDLQPLNAGEVAGSDKITKNRGIR